MNALTGVTAGVTAVLTAATALIAASTTPQAVKLFESFMAHRRAMAKLKQESVSKFDQVTPLGHVPWTQGTYDEAPDEDPFDPFAPIGPSMRSRAVFGDGRAG